MTDLIDRNGYQNCPTKQEVRVENFNAIRRLPIIWNRDHITRDVVTLCGIKDREIQLWLDHDPCPLIPGKGKIIGINGPDPTRECKPKEGITKESLAADAQAIIEFNKTHFADATEAGLVHWHYGSLEQALQDDLFPNAAVFLIDSHYRAGMGVIIANMPTYIQAAAQAALRHGHALLFLNAMAAGFPDTNMTPHQPQEEVLERHQVYLAGLLNKVTTRYRSPSDIQLTLYRSEEHKRTMAYTRITIDRAEVRR